MKILVILCEVGYGYREQGRTKFCWICSSTSGAYTRRHAKSDVTRISSVTSSAMLRELLRNFTPFSIGTIVSSSTTVLRKRLLLCAWSVGVPPSRGMLTVMFSLHLIVIIWFLLFLCNFIQNSEWSDDGPTPLTKNTLQQFAAGCWWITYEVPLFMYHNTKCSRISIHADSISLNAAT